MLLRLTLVAGGVGCAAAVLAIKTSLETPVAFVAAAEEEFAKSAYNAPPADYVGPLFKGKFDFPASAPANAAPFPWEGIDFRKEPEKYLRTVWDYCIENNITPNGHFNTSMTDSTRWYHAPWMHYSEYGREPINGLTMEPLKESQSLHEKQIEPVQSWVIAFYNEHSATQFAKIWQNKTYPNVKDVRFPRGSVSFKLLFSNASAKEVPWLKGAPEVSATIRDLKSARKNERKLETVRLVQVDVAVRDKRAEEEDGIGWVFGVLVYDGEVDPESENAWSRVVPLALQWGNDPGRTIADERAGKTLEQGWINGRVRDDVLTAGTHRPFLGYAGLPNGPMDDFRSACASCHATAQWPRGAHNMGAGVSEDAGTYNDPKDLPKDKADLLFRNLKCGEVFEPVRGVAVGALDYNLQAQIGIGNFHKWRKKHFPHMDEILPGRVVSADTLDATRATARAFVP